MRIRRMAFSCTCQPNRKEEKAQRVMAPMKVSWVGESHSFMRGNWMRD